MYTLNNIIKILKDYQTANNQIKSFFVGDIFDFGIEKDRLYPAMTVVIQPSEVGEYYEDFNFQIGFWDLVEDENTDQELEVQSDTKKMCKDLMAYIYQNYDVNLTLDLPVNITTLSGKFGDNLGGSFMDIKLKQSNSLLECKIPLNL